ncbi:hypothetical protein JB92DRAFT_2965732 [Gautieria morchelliformis]|nr:hypothetical protein JB92DRAFT_2965732 [Gautieria morchelliformis]
MRESQDHVTVSNDVSQLVIVAKYSKRCFSEINTYHCLIMSQPESHSPATPSHPVDEMDANTAQTSTTTNDPPTEHFDDARYPEQRHAGAVGYGPEYLSHHHAKDGATLGDKITGVTEQVVGKITRKPKLVKKGHDKETGEQKKQEQKKD